jgi:excisionase family DNA binding protein
MENSAYSLPKGKEMKETIRGTLMSDKLVEKLEKKAFSADDIAKITGLHVNTVRSLLRKGSISSIKLSRKYLVSLSNLNSWLNGNPPAGGASA